MSALIAGFLAAAVAAASPGAGWDDLYACAAASERMPELNAQMIADLRKTPSTDPDLRAVEEGLIQMLNASTALSPSVTAMDLMFADAALDAEFPAWAAARKETGPPPSKADLRVQLRLKAKAWAQAATLKDMETRHAACTPLQKALAADM